MSAVRCRSSMVTLALAAFAAALAGCEPLPMAVTVAPSPVAYTRPPLPGQPAGQIPPTVAMTAPATTPRDKPWPAADDPVVTVPLYTAPVYGAVGPR